MIITVEIQIEQDRDPVLMRERLLTVIERELAALSVQAAIHITTEADDDDDN